MSLSLLAGGPPSPLLLFAAFGTAHVSAQFFQFQGGGGGINLEDLMGGAFGGGGGRGGYEELPEQEEEEEEVDLYEILGLQPEANDREIKTAYRKLSIQYHPDKNPGNEDKFREVTEAYEILSNKEKRILYDYKGIAAARKGGAEEMGRSPMEMMFGMGGGEQRSNRGRDMEIELPVTLEDLYVGNEKSATIKRRIVCRNCKKKPNLPRCRDCGACPKEKKMVQRRAGPGMIVQQEVQVDSKEKCKREEKTLSATIEKGMPDNEAITFKYESEQKPGQIPGDVVLKLKTQPHATFKRSRENLSTKMTIPLRAALLGFETTISHLDGHQVSIKRTGVTKPGQSIRIKGEGMPKHGTPSEFGDLVITFTVDFPKEIGADLAAGLEQLLPKYGAQALRVSS
uniref:J domain-containing protein n=2 Tax=Chrysotila carterae TaxID=13221 RepID=A0A7S4BTB8_CHRCT|mmetsp:Transcript_28394/g.62172  ORF Transcript_28394/g.62172 Transcript_28394/m.62172 type:complete len:398 (+) Transcript_28394:90-1283(+)